MALLGSFGLSLELFLFWLSWALSWGSLGILWSLFWNSRGLSLDSFRLSWGTLGTPLAFLGLPWMDLGFLLACLGAFFLGLWGREATKQQQSVPVSFES